MSIFEQLQEIIADQLELDVEEISYDSHILDDLGADSLDLVDLLMSVEDEFGIEIPDEDVENISTIGDIVEYIDSKSN